MDGSSGAESTSSAQTGVKSGGEVGGDSADKPTTTTPRSEGATSGKTETEAGDNNNAANDESGKTPTGSDCGAAAATDKKDGEDNKEADSRKSTADEKAEAAATSGTADEEKKDKEKEKLIQQSPAQSEKFVADQKKEGVRYCLEVDNQMIEFAPSGRDEIDVDAPNKILCVSVTNIVHPVNVDVLSQVSISLLMSTFILSLSLKLKLLS